MTPGDAIIRTTPANGGGFAGDETLADWLSYRAVASPDRIALEAGQARWTYAELDAEASAVAYQFQALGAKPGDRIATLLPNGPAPVVLVHAILRLGGTLVPLNVRLSDGELAWQIKDAGVRVLVAEARTVELAGATLQALESSARDAAARAGIPALALVDGSAPGQVSLGGNAVAGADGTLRLAHPASHVLAVIYTSGTTGQPKGAQLTVGNFWWSAIGSALNLGAHTDDRWLAVLPLFHIGGLSIALRSAIHGTTVVVHSVFDADEVNRAIDEQRVTIVSVVSVMLQRMLEARGNRPCPSSLRCVLLGGGPAPITLLERCAASGIPVVQTYGLTEACSQVATLSPRDALRKRGAAGRPLYPNAVRIMLADGSDAAPGEPGEILVRGPIVMAGYSGQPEATARTIVQGWLHTRDIGSVDADGFLHVHDRRDDLIITGGENVYPAEVEAALLRHPWVAEAGVIGVPDETWGQRVVAVVRLSGAPASSQADSADVLRAHCRTLLAGYKVPGEIRITRDELPRTASGKLKRSALRSNV